jgi:hypothetical protein
LKVGRVFILFFFFFARIALSHAVPMLSANKVSFFAQDATLERRQFCTNRIVWRVYFETFAVAPNDLLKQLDNAAHTVAFEYSLANFFSQTRS